LQILHFIGCWKCCRHSWRSFWLAWRCCPGTKFYVRPHTHTYLIGWV